MCGSTVADSNLDVHQVRGNSVLKNGDGTYTLGAKVVGVKRFVRTPEGEGGLVLERAIAAANDELASRANHQICRIQGDILLISEDESSRDVDILQRRY